MAQNLVHSKVYFICHLAIKTEYTGMNIIPGIETLQANVVVAQRLATSLHRRS